MWKSKMSNFVTLVLFMFFFFIFTGQAMAIDLGDGVKTGMTFPEVSEAIADTDNHVLKEKVIIMQLEEAFDILLNEAYENIEKQKEEYLDFDFTYHEQALDTIEGYVQSVTYDKRGE